MDIHLGTLVQPMISIDSIQGDTEVFHLDIALGLSTQEAVFITEIGAIPATGITEVATGIEATTGTEKEHGTIIVAAARIETIADTMAVVATEEHPRIETTQAL